VSIQSLEQLQIETRAIVEQITEVEYERLVQLVELREIALADVQQASVIEDEDRAIIRELATFDELLNKRMMTLKQEAADALRKLNVSRQQKQAYEYDVGSSFFYDKKR